MPIWVGSPGCKLPVGIAEFNPMSWEIPCVLHWRYLTGAIALYFLLQRSLLLLLCFLLCAQEFCFPRGEASAAGWQRANHSPKSLSCSTMQFKVLRARIKGGNHFQQDKEKSELVQVLQAKKKAWRMKRETKRQKNQVLALWTARMLVLCWLSVEMIPHLCNLGPLGLIYKHLHLDYQLKETFLINFAKWLTLLRLRTLHAVNAVTHFSWVEGSFISCGY